MTNKDKKQLIDDCMKGHYLLMSHKQFWYNKDMQELSKKLCIIASNLRLELANKCSVYS